MGHRRRPDGHPTSFIRGDLTERGVVTATDLADVASGERVLVGGVVTHRQRPATAQGTTFLNLEDETGLINVVVSKGCWQRYRQIAKGAPALLIRGRLEKEEGVINIVADKLEPPMARATRLLIADDPFGQTVASENVSDDGSVPTRAPTQLSDGGSCRSTSPRPSADRLGLRRRSAASDGRRARPVGRCRSVRHARRAGGFDGYPTTAGSRARVLEASASGRRARRRVESPRLVEFQTAEALLARTVESRGLDRRHDGACDDELRPEAGPPTLAMTHPQQVRVASKRSARRLGWAAVVLGACDLDVAADDGLATIDRRTNG